MNTRVAAGYQRRYIALREGAEPTGADAPLLDHLIGEDGISLPPFLQAAEDQVMIRAAKRIFGAKEIKA